MAERSGQGQAPDDGRRTRGPIDRRSRRAGPAPADDVEYSEALRTPWWWYVVGVVVAVILGAEFHMADETLTDWIPYLVLVPLALFIVWWVGHSPLSISDGEVRIRGAHVPLDVVSGAVGLDQRTLRLVVGREGDPAAFVCIRPWVGPGVQLWLDDADDPTPYWVVSSRHPERVVEIVRSHRAATEAATKAATNGVAGEPPDG